MDEFFSSVACAMAVFYLIVPVMLALLITLALLYV